jgi:hypothetical protein
MELTPKQRQDVKTYAPQLKEMGFVLRTVRDHSEMPRTKGYLYSRYKNLGLVKPGYRKTKSGKKVFNRVLLTDKGHKMVQFL